MKTPEDVRIHGLLAEFETPSELVAAVRKAHQDGWQKMDCYSPFPIEEVTEMTDDRHNSVALFTLLGGLFGLIVTALLTWWVSAVTYPLNIGGRPLNSWPAFVVPVFEGTILCAGLATFVAMLALNRLPELYHPLFNAENFRTRASSDRFFLCLEAKDAKFESEETRKYLLEFAPCSVVEVEE
jgi:hypothetical protein